jgi:glycosyltransferase involved in cell wall biosynthesis
MKVVLATGIYPPDIGGPATYVQALAKELVQQGVEVTVLTYGKSNHNSEGKSQSVVYIAKWGPILRWWRYARALRAHASDADIVYVFSSVSCGVPLLLSRIKQPKRLLRLGGDFGWERYTDRGGNLGLKDWYASRPWVRSCMQRLLRQFHHVIFSTDFQQNIYKDSYRYLPPHSVLENAIPEGTPELHTKHEPFRILFLGRFVGFKNLPLLLRAVAKVPGVRLTLVGSGPMEKALRSLATELLLEQRVTFLGAVHGDDKQQTFKEYDLLILPSITEISPNAALEARAAGLPVLLTDQTGLSNHLHSDMTLAPLATPIEITRALADAISQYDALANAAAQPVPKRTWKDVADEHFSLFQKLL